MNYADYEIGRMQTFISEFKNKKLRELEEKKNRSNRQDFKIKFWQKSLNENKVLQIDCQNITANNMKNNW